ncbi:hypothetical protein D3C79_929510 [compost metagenome]
MCIIDKFFSSKIRIGSKRISGKLNFTAVWMVAWRQHLTCLNTVSNKGNTEVRVTRRIRQVWPVFSVFNCIIYYYIGCYFFAKFSC